MTFPRFKASPLRRTGHKAARSGRTSLGCLDWGTATVGSQPLEVPDLKYLHQTLEMMSAETMMLFATDYPHWDFDDPQYVMARLPKHMRQAIAYDNARQLYGL